MLHFIKTFLSVVALAGMLWSPTPRAASAEDAAPHPASPPVGLMWHRTGLPTVFPLQVKSPAGRDYVLTLIDSATGAEALAAYVEGGAFFRVLVPPGRYRVRFAAGRAWRGDEELFGPGALTEQFELEAPLTFEIRNPGIKTGHIIDLSTAALGQIAQAQTSALLVCQTIRSEVLRLPVSGETELAFRGVESRHSIQSWREQLIFPEQRRSTVFYPPIHFAYRGFRRRGAVRTRVCGGG